MPGGGGFEVCGLYDIKPAKFGVGDLLVRNLLDLRLTKIFSLGSGKRLRANFDIYNVMNDASVLVPNNNYGAFWRQQAAASPGGSWSPACSSSVLN